MTTTTKPPRTCANCARVRVMGEDMTHFYACSITRKPVNPQDTCECWKKKRP